MTEYDYSPEAYDRYLANQNRIANWVDKTEQHRAEFQPPQAATRPADLSKAIRPSHSESKQFIHPPSPVSSSSDDSYYEGPWPAQNPPMHLPQMQRSPQPMVMPPCLVTPPHKSSHHHRHRSHDHRRSRSHPSPAYYTPPLSPPYQYTTYPGANQAYPMAPQYGAPVMAQLPRSAPPSVTSFNAPLPQPPSYLQPQPRSAFLASNSQLYPSPTAWPSYGAPSPVHSMMSTSATSPLSYPTAPPYQSFAVQQPPYLVPMAYQRVHDLRKHRHVR